MSRYKTDKYIQDIITNEYQKTSMHKMYEFGMAVGCFTMLKNIKPLISEYEYEDFTDAFCEQEGRIFDYLRELIELDNQSDKSIEEMQEKLENMKKYMN